MSYYIRCPTSVNSEPFTYYPIVNDLPIVLGQCQILMYVDDTAMYFSASNAQEIGSTLTIELAKVNDLLVDNCPFVNQGKTECILFGTDCRLANANYSVNMDDN